MSSDSVTITLGVISAVASLFAAFFGFLIHYQTSHCNCGNASFDLGSPVGSSSSHPSIPSTVSTVSNLSNHP